jgi:hypothetical protein
LKQNLVKPMLWWTLFVIAIGWLYFAWIPMMQHDNDIDPQEVLQDSQAKIGEVRTKLRDLQMQEADASTRSESLATLPANGK